MDEIELLRSETQARVLAVQQDLQRANLELAHEKQQNSELESQILQMTEQHAAEVLQIEASLAAAQLRCEQLQEMHSDVRTQNYEFEEENQQLVKQLDMAREEYFRVQRTEEQQRDEMIRMEQRIQEERAISAQKLDTLRQALRGAVCISNQRSKYADVVGALLETDCSKEVMLAKIAELSTENAALREKTQTLETSNETLRRRTEQFSKIYQLNSVPSVAVLMEQLDIQAAELDAARAELKSRDTDVNKLRRDIEELVCENKRLRCLCLEMRENLRSVGELRAAVKEMINE